jgi:hypothetical protein
MDTTKRARAECTVDEEIGHSVSPSFLRDYSVLLVDLRCGWCTLWEIYSWDCSCGDYGWDSWWFLRLLWQLGYRNGGSWFVYYLCMR